MVSYFDIDAEDWMRVQIIGTQKPSSVHKHYFNVKFLDVLCEDDGVYLHPGSYWTFGLPAPKDQDPAVPGTDPCLEVQAASLEVSPSQDDFEVNPDSDPVPV